MLRNNLFETVLSTAVILVALGFLALVYQQTGTGKLSSYPLSIRMAHADGITPGTDVRVAGVKVGTVDSVTLDQKNYLVTVDMHIRSDVRLPVDSGVAVGGGLLSSAALSIAPGHSAQLIAPGGALKPAR